MAPSNPSTRGPRIEGPSVAGPSSEMGGRDSFQNPIHWPDLKLWLKCNEGSGTTLVDHSSNPIASNVTITATGGHAPWGVPGYFQTAAAYNDAAFSVGFAPRLQIDKLALAADKAILIEFYGSIAAYSVDTNRFQLAVSDYTSATNYGYAMRIRKSGSSYRVEMCAGGTVAQNRTNATDNTTNFPLATLAHAACWYGGPYTLEAGAAVNGTAIQNAMSGTVGDVNVTAGESTARRLKIGTISSSPSSTDTLPGNYSEVRVWLFDTLPSNILAIVSEMAASPLKLPTLLRRSYTGDDDGTYSIGAGFSDS